MKTSTNNVIQISTKFVTANVAPPETPFGVSLDPSVNNAVAELRELWSATNTLVLSSRDSLYEFLGVTYEFGQTFGADSATLDYLRDSVRQLYPSDKQKKGVKRKSTVELLLAVSMGIEQASLRSKYKRILSNASDAGVSADRESFKLWLKGIGGIVSALKATVGALEDAAKGESANPRTVDSIAGDLIGNYDQMEKEHRTFESNHNGFTVVLYYTKPGTNEAAKVAVLADPTIVESAIKLAPKTIVVVDSIAVAA